MPQVLRLSHACLGSRDLQRTIDFYTQHLGATVAHEFRKPDGFLYGVFLGLGGGTFIEFFLQETAPPAGGLFRHICLQVDDIQGLASELNNKGLPCEVSRSRSDKTLQCWITDPDGTKVEFHQYDTESLLTPHAR